MGAQEAIVALLVAGAVLFLGKGFFQAHLARPVSEWLLRRGKVKWAMRTRYGTWSGRPPRRRNSGGDCCQ